MDHIFSFKDSDSPLTAPFSYLIIFSSYLAISHRATVTSVLRRKKHARTRNAEISFHSAHKSS